MCFALQGASIIDRFIWLSCLMRSALSLTLLLLLCGCAARRVPVSQDEAEALNPSFLEIQPGTRLRVITPVLKSGGYVAKTLTEITPGDPFNLRVGNDYIGYADDYYLAKPHGVGVRIEFQSADIVKEGKSTPQSQPTLNLFRFSLQMRFIRLVYLVRVSGADHNTAIVAGQTQADVESATSRLQSDPLWAVNATCTLIACGCLRVWGYSRKFPRRPIPKPDSSRINE
jgi:hypothetical protein